MNLIRLNTALVNNEQDWTFIGTPGWKEDHEGYIYPPVWSNPRFDRDPSQVPDHYAHELAREDYAFLTSQPLGDTDISVDYKCPYGSVIHGGVVFRAVDSSRCYVLDIVDMGRKGHCYELILWLQDASGYRKELARGRTSHSVVLEKIVQRGAQTRYEWNHSSPDWVTVRVQASGTFIRVLMDGQIVFELRDQTYPAGCVGLVGRGAVYFRNLRVEGVPAELSAPWTKHEGELPRFFYPGGEQLEGFNAFPVVCHTEGGVTLVAWAHGPLREGYASDPTFVTMTRSEDEGCTWSQPQCIFRREGHECGMGSFFAHLDGSVSCLVSGSPVGQEEAIPLTFVMQSLDGGRNWSDPTEFRAGGKRLQDHEHRVYLYSPMIRLSDGTVVMSGYETRTIPGGSLLSNADRLDRSLLFRSTDDGHTWEDPIYFDPNNFDHNECMVAEVEPGRLVAFMRTLRAGNMWTSTSTDGGQTWTSLAQSTVSGECPYLFRHSSGVLIVFNRGCGSFLKLSFDQGKSWTRECRISPASAMIGMTEMADGRVLIVMHEGYRVPGYIRAQFFRVTPDGPEPAE
jgi:hypothetical protein